MKVLVTGCSSYIGKYITKKLLSEGIEVCGISRSDPCMENDFFKWVSHDLSLSPLRFSENEFDYIVHVAGLAWANKSASDYIKSNLILTCNTAEMIKYIKPKGIVYTSSRDIYGEVLTGILDETSDIHNPSVYGCTKYLGEFLLQEICPTVILRMPAVLGVGSHGWIASVYNKLIKNQEISVVNTEFNNLIHVYDVAEIILKSINRFDFTDQIFNLSASDITTSKDVVMQLKELAASSSNIVERPADRKMFTISNDKLAGFYKTMTVNESLALYVSEMKKQTERG